jgi:general secretion pathway protein G
MKRFSMRRRCPRGGFTLFEVLLVLAILIILTSSVSYYVIGAQKKAFVRAAQAQIGLFHKMLEDFHLDVGSYPSTELGLNSLRVQPDGLTKWQGPYAANEIPMDPWQNPYQYACTGDEYQIWSWGPDGADGTGDEIMSQ